MSKTPDPLWDPDLQGDEVLQRLTSALGAYRYAPRQGDGWSARPAAIPHRRRRRWVLAGAAALCTCVMGLVVWMPWRLQWQENRHWSIAPHTVYSPAALDVGSTLTTGGGSGR
ncbi:hypothetical protein [Pseudoxanthomonas mexicana]